jgi:hypothetical protein
MKFVTTLVAALSISMALILLSSCSSKKSVTADIEQYCQIAEQTLGPALKGEHFYSQQISEVFQRWLKAQPSKDAVNALESYFDAAYKLRRQAKKKETRIAEKEYRALMDAALADFGGTPKTCGVVFEATVRGVRQSTAKSFVLRVCDEYGVLRGKAPPGSDDRAGHESLWREAIASVADDFGDDALEGRDFFERFMEGAQRGKGETLKADLERWLDMPIDSTNPCRIVIKDIAAIP